MDNGLIVYPNPAHDVLTVSIDVRKSEGESEGESGITSLTLQLTDITGRVVLSENEIATEGLNTYQLGLNHLSKGVYMLHIQSAAGTQALKVVIE